MILLRGGKHYLVCFVCLGCLFCVFYCLPGLLILKATAGSAPTETVQGAEGQ